MSFNINPALEFLARSSFTAKSRTIEQVELIVLSRLGSVGKLASNSSVDDPIYCAIESPQGKDGLNGICFALAFTLAIVFDLREDVEDDFDKDVDVDVDLILIEVLFFISALFLFNRDDSDFDDCVVAFEVFVVVALLYII